MDFSQRRRVEFQTDVNSVGRRDSKLTSSPQKNLRKPRHAGIFQAIHRLDAQLDPAARDEISHWIRDEYNSELGDIPLGFVAQCHLGPPYVDHRLDLLHSILDHFAPADAMPEPFAQARMLVRTGAYAYVEIYGSGTIVPVLADGSVVT